MIITSKFGGSSLSDASQFKKVRGIIEADPNRRYVVPSAPGKRDYSDEKITDLLYRCEKLAAKGSDFSKEFSYIEERYVDIAFELELSIDILPHLQEVRERIAAGAGPDYAASRGEYLCGLLLADYLGYEFVDPAAFIRFSEAGEFLGEETHRLAKERLREAPRAVIPGFYGARADGAIATFSRGGSDITGAIVARATYSGLYENWTDVSGFLMADPRIVHGPKNIEFVTYHELRELAYMGATVLHEEAIFPVRHASIPINVRNTNRPGDPGTMIIPESPDAPDLGAVTGIAGRKGFTVIALEKDRMNSEVGFAARVLVAIAKYGISIEHMPTGIDTLSIVVNNTQLEGKRQQVLDEIMQSCTPDSIEVHDNMALIAVVGRGMVRRIGVSAKLFGALAAEGVNIRMIDQGSSELNIIIGVEGADFNRAMQAIYDAFVNDEE